MRKFGAGIPRLRSVRSFGSDGYEYGVIGKQSTYFAGNHIFKDQ